MSTLKVSGQVQRNQANEGKSLTGWRSSSHTQLSLDQDQYSNREAAQAGTLFLVLWASVRCRPIAPISSSITADLHGNHTYWADEGSTQIRPRWSNGWWQKERERARDLRLGCHVGFTTACLRRERSIRRVVGQTREENLLGGETPKLNCEDDEWDKDRCRPGEQLHSFWGVRVSDKWRWRLH